MVVQWLPEGVDVDAPNKQLPQMCKVGKDKYQVQSKCREKEGSE